MKKYIMSLQCISKKYRTIQSSVIEGESKREKNMWANEARAKKEKEIVHNPLSLFKLFYHENKQQEWSKKRWVAYLCIVYNGSLLIEKFTNC